MEIKAKAQVPLEKKRSKSLNFNKKNTDVHNVQNVQNSAKKKYKY